MKSIFLLVKGTDLDHEEFLLAFLDRADAERALKEQDDPRYGSDYVAIREVAVWPNQPIEDDRDFIAIRRGSRGAR